MVEYRLANALGIVAKFVIKRHRLTSRKFECREYDKKIVLIRMRGVEARGNLLTWRIEATVVVAAKLHHGDVADILGRTHGIGGTQLRQRNRMDRLNAIAQVGVGRICLSKQRNRHNDGNRLNQADES